MKVKTLALKSMLGLMIICSVHFKADAQMTAFATVGTNSPAPNITFTGTCGGQFNLATNNAFVRSKLGPLFNNDVTVQFTPLFGNCAGYSISAQGIWHLPMIGPNGNPSLFQVTDNSSGNILLQGQFKRAILHGRNGSSSLALTLWEDNVLYNPLNSPLLNGLSPEKGSFSIAILSRLPVAASGNGPIAFPANGDINFGAPD